MHNPPTHHAGRSGRWIAGKSAALLVAAACFAGLGTSGASALTEVTTADGDAWYVNDAAAPGLDTGSIRNTADNALQGFGGIRMDVEGSTNRLNGILLRGFGVTSDGEDGFDTTTPVSIDGIVVSRELVLDTDEGYGRFFDSFTNTTREPQTISVAFGGQLGYNTGTNQTAIAGTSSGDAELGSDDVWAAWYTPSSGPGSASANGPSATVFGGIDRTGDFQQGPFDVPLATSGDDANHPGLVADDIVIQPGTTVSLVHYVVAGRDETEATAGEQVDAVQAMAADLAAEPDLAGLSKAQLCTVTNFDLSDAFSSKGCAGLVRKLAADEVKGAVSAPVAVTSSPYDVVGKTIAELTADMNSGATTAVEITQAYLDRIAAYDQGPLGLHAVLTVAPDALEQAAAADAARAAGDDRPLLGIPILIKDIIDTKDMPTTGGSVLFEGYVPTTDSWQVAKLRDAGAIILGKANLSKFAWSGHFSESDFGQVWNAFDPSKSSIGSSGGSAVGLASSFAAAAMGTQTGDSLWGPAGAASIWSLRGTDGMQSSQGTMPLAAVRDYVGFFAQSGDDLALLLNVTARDDNPADPLDDVSNGNRPADWSADLSTDALQGKVIGVPESAFDDPFGTTEVSDALRARFADFETAGATVKTISNAPTYPFQTGWTAIYNEGWGAWIADHPDNPYTEIEEITGAPGERMTEAEVAFYEAERAEYRDILAAWMDEEGVDAVLYPTELSDIHLNDTISPSFGRRDPESSISGVPTLIFPAGMNANGSPVSFQLQGKEFQDAELLAMAYAFDNVADGRVIPIITPALPYAPGAHGKPVTPAHPLPEAAQPWNRGTLPDTALAGMTNAELASAADLPLIGG
ncbi:MULTISPECIES: amidase [Tessaracoccus]|uniref:amidase n=1 Tax=Tessaracoccus TaxID=72763 RepID=UPI00099C69C8|nr:MULTISPECIES: amidase [Tessaracoccus]AQX16958.1 hypothetical protein BKM78_14315 [Tessaracoccus sp. T2.5-30]VEP41791.1 Glutamyl-tRNA(Gln) amidotransferase subunit A [Tessaracoccus lapidicaptus]